MKQTSIEEADFSFSPLSETDPIHLAYLLGTIEKMSIKRTQNSSYFISTEKKKGVIDSPPQALPQLPEPPAHLSGRQKEGWLWFWKKGAALSENFSKAELQKQFRYLARALHPDQNPHPRATEIFIQLREHYESLSVG